MKLTLLLILVVLAANVAAQVEHAPTVAQCQADQRLWLAQMEENVNNLERLPSYKVSIERRIEMNECERVDPQNQPRYYNTWVEISADLEERLRHFVVRHELMAQFLLEDLDGKR